MMQAGHISLPNGMGVVVDNNIITNGPPEPIARGWSHGATGLAYNITKGEQDTLNPFGINCIRAFPGRGIRVWGARTSLAVAACAAVRG